MTDYNDFISVEFSYTDMFGNKANLKREVANDYCGLAEMEILIDLFRDFLCSAGFVIDPHDELKLVKKD